MSQVVAECNSTVLLEDGDQLVLAERSGDISPTVLYVLVLLAVIFGVNALLQVLLFAAGDQRGSFLLAAIPTALTAFLVWICTLLFKRRRAARERMELRNKLILDRRAGALLDPRGTALAPLAAIRFERHTQLTSSSKALECAWPGGSMVVARGNPFGSSVDEIADALATRGIKVA